MFHLELPSKDKEGEESDAKKRKLETGEASNDENVSGNEGIFLQPYLLFDNTCLEVMTYVKGIVGGEYESMVRVLYICVVLYFNLLHLTYIYSCILTPMCRVSKALL
jgi:hypothetical protein